jgi:hypothetical protein
LNAKASASATRFPGSSKVDLHGYTASMVRVMDATDLLCDGDLPPEDSPSRLQALRVARLIEYAGPIGRGESCVTLFECPLRPGRRRCFAFLWVKKDMDDRIVASCPRCGQVLFIISNWRGTLWSDGPMVLPGSDGSAGVN